MVVPAAVAGCEVEELLVDRATLMVDTDLVSAYETFFRSGARLVER